MPALAAGSNEVPPATAKQALAGHVRVMGILWAIYSGLRVLIAIWTIVFSQVFLPGFLNTFAKTFAENNNGQPDMIPVMQGVFHLMSGFYVVSAIFGFLAGALGFWTAWALLKRQPSGRILALVVACVSLISIPLGTALGVYTLVIFIPEKASRTYQELVTASV